MIYNKHFAVYTALVFCCLGISTCAFAAQYEAAPAICTGVYSSDMTAKADEYFNKALTETDTDKRYYYLKDAGAAYYMSIKTDKGNICAHTQLARVYDLQGQEKNARAAFNTALGINPDDKFANYYFGDYYFFRKEYGKALRYYRTAFINGMEENYSGMKKMAVIYEKLGDLQKANLFYKKTYLKNMNDEATADKIREIEQIKYNNSDYYGRKIK